MAFGRLQRAPGAQPMSDINMTPLIDVMLVLLVIFMISAPLMTASLKLDLPQAKGAAPRSARTRSTMQPSTSGCAASRARAALRCSCVPTRPCPMAASRR